MRVVDVVFLALAIGGAAYVYNVKHEAEEAHDLRRSLERDIAVMTRDVSLLEADLAALEQPARLQNLVATLPQSFNLEPIAARHYMRIADIPFRADAPEPVDEELQEDVTGDAPIAVVNTPPSALDTLVEALVDDAQVNQASMDTVVPTQASDLDAASDGIGALLGDAQ